MNAEKRRFYLPHIVVSVKTTEYFKHVQARPDRSWIREAWIQQAIDRPIRTEIQPDGRFRCWTYISSESKYLRVILLADRETVHNAFFDRDFDTGMP